MPAKEHGKEPAKVLLRTKQEKGAPVNKLTISARDLAPLYSRFLCLIRDAVAVSFCANFALEKFDYPRPTVLRLGTAKRILVVALNGV